MTAWSATGTYAVGDVVTYNGLSYSCILAVGPSATTPDVDTTHWQLVRATPRTSRLWKDRG